MSDDPVQRSITAFWSMIAPYYEAHAGNVPARDSAEHAAWIEAMRALLPPAPADVLDIGTGTGFSALIAAGLGHRVTGIDLSEEMLGLVAIDGHWFEAAAPAPGDETGAELSPDEEATFDRYYSRETRRALPLMAATDTVPVVAIAERAGWRDVRVSFLDAVHAHAEHPPSALPWYVVVARR